MKKIIKRFAERFGVEIKRYRSECVSLGPGGHCQGHVLLSYILEPFNTKAGEPVSSCHTNYWESLQIARTFLDLGYAVDVIHWSDDRFTPQKEYSIFVGARTNFQRIAELLNDNCLKIVHLDTAHWLFNGFGEYMRCLDLQKRRGVTLRSFRSVKPNWAIEYADCATILGNDFTISTYKYAQKPLYRLPVPAITVYPWPENKDFETCRNRFLWFGGNGLVHKGLDLALEVFSKMPEYHLTVCGPIHKEKDFESTYYKELYKTPNIHTIGWVDVTSNKFMEIASNCIGMIYPSCSEGQSGCVITCLHAGLIPIISHESGVDIDDFGIILRGCSLDEITTSIQRVSGLSAMELKEMGRAAWEFARANYTREVFSEKYRQTIEDIIRGGK
jgi:glycosyltransferase involved in cell wall biosynthesis